ncbi:MAG: LysM peptidoglycan-binding domain-containing protein [Bacteroidaceae bacterium]|nr:LysM peptidoglycan-binding domain-containing protein [Bacteroidaceae bacterium]
MNQRLTHLFLLLTCVLWLAWPPYVNAQTVYMQHTVEAHETLYGIARQFGVKIDDVLAANPGLTSQNLRRGQVINIPTTPDAPTTRTAPQVSGSTRVHVVAQGETIWGIAHQYGISVEALRTANPQLSDPAYVLPVGAKLVIPAGATLTAPAPQSVGVRIALVLPLKAQRAEVERCVEFYHGLLIAADELKQRGHSVYIYVYEEDPNDGTLTDLLSKLRTKPVDIIYGPLYPNHFGILSDYARRNGVRLVVPFSSKVSEVERNASVYLVNTPESYKARAAADVVARQFGNTHLVILHAAKPNEQTFVAQLKTKVANKGATFSELPVNFTNQQILNVFSHHDRILFVSDASDEATYQAVLARLDKLRAEMPLLSTSFLAYPDWQKYQDNDRMKWYACDTYLFCPSFYNPYDDGVKIFVRKYRDRYHTDLLPLYPRYGALGYDVALQTLSGFFAHGDQYHGQEVLQQPAVQSHLRFERTQSQGGFVNTNIWLMHFKKTRAIDLIGVR